MTTQDRKATYWPTPKALLALMGLPAAVVVRQDERAELAYRERVALDDGLQQLAHGWTPNEIVAVLQAATPIIADLRATAQDVTS